MATENATDEAIITALQYLPGSPEDEGLFVILEGDADRNYYLQFAGVGGGLYCEAVSNRYLEPADQLDEAQMATLRDLGWGMEAEDLNWSCAFDPTPEGFAGAVALARRTFTEVYGLPAGAPLLMKDDTDDTETDPTLRLTTESAGAWDDPSEDALFEYMGDLGPGNTWLEVERLVTIRDDDAFRLALTDTARRFDLEVRTGATVRRARGVEYRVAHEALTRWAFDLPEFDHALTWEP